MSQTTLVRFADVKAVLDGIIANWTAGNGAPPMLTLKHGPTFMWDTREHLLAAAFNRRNKPPIPLIQPEIIGKVGLGITANIVVDLIKGLTPSNAPPYPQMPLGGLDSNSGKYLAAASPEIVTIVAWIEGGCPG